MSDFEQKFHQKMGYNLNFQKIFLNLFKVLVRCLEKLRKMENSQDLKDF